MNTYTKQRTKRQLRHMASRSQSHRLDKQEGGKRKESSWVGVSTPQRLPLPYNLEEVLATTFAPWVTKWEAAALAAKKDPRMWLANQGAKARADHVAPKS